MHARFCNTPKIKDCTHRGYLTLSLGKGTVFIRSLPTRTRLSFLAFPKPWSFLNQEMQTGMLPNIMFPHSLAWFPNPEFNVDSIQIFPECFRGHLYFHNKLQFHTSHSKFTRVLYSNKRAFLATQYQVIFLLSVFMPKSRKQSNRQPNYSRIQLHRIRKKTVPQLFYTFQLRTRAVNSTFQ